MLSWVKPLLQSVAAFADFPSTQSLVTKYVPLAVLAALLAASLIKAVRVWGEIHDVEEPDTPSDLLASFEQAHAEGALDDAEFARVSAQLGGSSCAPAAVESASPRGDESSRARVVPLEGNHGRPPLSPQA
jgi:hypothetical protein